MSRPAPRSFQPSLFAGDAPEWEAWPPGVPREIVTGLAQLLTQEVDDADPVESEEPSGPRKDHG